MESVGLLIIPGRLYKSCKQRVRIVRTGLEFGMSLSCNVECVLRILDHLNDAVIGRQAAKLKAVLF